MIYALDVIGNVGLIDTPDGARIFDPAKLPGIAGRAPEGSHIAVSEATILLPAGAEVLAKALPVDLLADLLYVYQKDTTFDTLVVQFGKGSESNSYTDIVEGWAKRFPHATRPFVWEEILRSPEAMHFAKLRLMMVRQLACSFYGELSLTGGRFAGDELRRRLSELMTVTPPG